MCTIVLIIPAGKVGFTSVICENRVCGSHFDIVCWICVVAFNRRKFLVLFFFSKCRSNQMKINDLFTFYLFFFTSPCVCFMLPQDGSRGRSGWKKRRLQPALWHLGCGHYCNRTGWTTAPYVWPAPHEVESSAILEMKTFFAICTIKGSKVITSIVGFQAVLFSPGLSS